MRPRHAKCLGEKRIAVVCCGWGGLKRDTQANGLGLGLKELMTGILNNIDIEKFE